VRGHPTTLLRVPAYEFLSPEWIDAVTAIRDEYAGRVPESDFVLRANLLITEVPFANGELRGSVDTSKGLTIEPVELDAPDLTAQLDYATAKALFVEQDPQAILDAFFRGKIRITGDASKLLTLPLPKPGDSSPELDLLREISARVKAVTA
jgi:hypothetical protein